MLARAGSGPATTEPDPDSTTSRPAAVVDGMAISFASLRPALIESAGGLALEEAMLDALLARQAQRQGITITAAQIEAEQALLADSLTSSGLTPAGDAGRVLDRIRAARGLGETRYASMLKRNALMRALVAPDVSITPIALDQAYSFRYGERYAARLIVVTTAADAIEARRRAQSGEEFSALAAELSTDASAARGGVLEPISPADPSYPAGVRSALRGLKPGEISAPIAIDEGFALLKLDSVIPGATPPPPRESVTTELERDVRVQQERLLMNQLARRLIADADLTVMDPALERAWRTRSGGGR